MAIQIHLSREQFNSLPTGVENYVNAQMWEGADVYQFSVNKSSTSSVVFVMWGNDWTTDGAYFPVEDLVFVAPASKWECIGYDEDGQPEYKDLITGLVRSGYDLIAMGYTAPLGDRPVHPSASTHAAV